ncbi:MAG TPA: putative glycoside hydrolase [Symbiobacteriaceae bacterium]|nr:putative glycoside hydrolase [Symbiobacteriaceae bacterium]
MSKRLIAAMLLSTTLLTACTGKSDTTKQPEPSTPPTEQTTTPKPNPEPAPQPAPEPPKPVVKKAPTPVRGFTVSGWYAGSPDLVWPLLDWAKTAGLNTIILDLKAEDGLLSWESDVPQAKAFGANEKKVGNLEEFVKEAHKRGFWVGGRIVTFNDKMAYKAKPEWRIPGFEGQGYAFIDPKNEDAWAYNIAIAKEAVAKGVDEIQFDYVRYPEKWIDGYNRDTTFEYRVGNITNFLKKAYSELKPLGVVVGADLFGLTTSVAQGDDMKIGQDYKTVIEAVDYVAAMAYPSHYDQGTYGIDNPNAHPYETVKASLQKALERTPGVPMEKHRPWIQDFTLGGVHYGPDEVFGQVKALRELGIQNFMLWDPQNKYNRAVNYNQ